MNLTVILLHVILIPTIVFAILAFRHYRKFVSVPYSFVITNTSEHPLPVIMFNPYRNRTANNFGNALNVSIVYGYTGYTYTEFLASVEARGVRVNAVKVLNVSNPIAIKHTNERCDGVVSSSLLLSINDSKLHRTNFVLAGDDEISFVLEGKKTITLYLYAGHLKSWFQYVTEKIRKF